RHRLPEEVERELGVTYHPDAESLVPVCDVVTINAPLHPETEHLFDDALIAKMKRGAYIVNTARGKICDRDAIARALESGQLAGYAGDVWFPQPAAWEAMRRAVGFADSTRSPVRVRRGSGCPIEGASRGSAKVRQPPTVKPRSRRDFVKPRASGESSSARLWGSGRVVEGAGPTRY